MNTVDSDDVPFAALAKRQGVSPSYFTRLVRLSYLAPDITQAILDGRQPRDLTAKRKNPGYRLGFFVPAPIISALSQPRQKSGCACQPLLPHRGHPLRQRHGASLSGSTRNSSGRFGCLRMRADANRNTAVRSASPTSSAFVAPLTRNTADICWSNTR
jgi:hypothetical protein